MVPISYSLYKLQEREEKYTNLYRNNLIVRIYLCTLVMMSYFKYLKKYIMIYYHAKQHKALLATNINKTKIVKIKKRVVYSVN